MTSMAARPSAEAQPMHPALLALGALVVLLALIFLPRLSIGQNRLVGQAAPDFNLEVVHNGERGSRLRLGDLQGHPVLLDFWATWCGPCKMEAPLLSRVAARYRDRGLIVIGVNTSDQPGLAGAFAAREALAYPIVFDDQSVANERYGVDVLPTLVLVGKDGKVRAVRAGLVDESALDAMVAAEL